MEIESFFAKDGPLAAAMPGYRPRDGQIAMAKTVEESLIGGCHVLEAGTGIGKLSLIWRRLCKTIGRRLFPPARALCKTSCFYMTFLFCPRF